MKGNNRLAVIGSGVMGEALLSGILGRGKFRPDQVVVTDPRASRLADLKARYGVSTATDNVAAAMDADLVILAVKPQIVAGVLSEIGTVMTGGTVVSIAAGISLSFLESRLPDGVTVVRAMPNSPCQVGAGAVALSAGRGVNDDVKSYVTDTLESVGRTVWVGEELMDAVTGLSGSGPAYVFLLIEALADGGVRAGLTRDAAQELAAQTVLGSARMVLETGTHPAVLRERVCTPGGTTIAGLFALEQKAFRAAVMEAVDASAARSRELAKRFAGKES
jgi:pyrroline-5-carboxylate reductase